MTILSFFCHFVCSKLFARCSNHLLDASWEDAFISPVIFHNAHLALSSIHFHFQSHCGPSLLSPLQQAGPASTLITIGRGVIDKAFFHQLTDGGLVNWWKKKKRELGESCVLLLLLLFPHIFLAFHEQLASVTRRESWGKFFTTLRGWTHFCHYSSTEDFSPFSSLSCPLSGQIESVRFKAGCKVLLAPSSLTGG